MGPCLPFGQFILSDRPAGQPKGRGDEMFSPKFHVAPAQAGAQPISPLAQSWHESAAYHGATLAMGARGMTRGPGGWVYIMTNAPHGTLYSGVTSNIAARIHCHREGTGSEFCSKHGLTQLVYVERHDRIEDAIAREKAMKKWKRMWKLRLIRQANPYWRDLFELVNA